MKPISILLLLSYFTWVCHSQTTSLNIKILLEKHEYMIPICLSNGNNCLGYADVDVGRDAMVTSIIIKDHFAYILDAKFRNIAKMDLNTGKIIGKSKILKEENMSGIYDFFTYNDSIYFLSDCTGTLYRLGTNLQITNVSNFHRGIPVKVVFLEDSPYILHAQLRSFKDTITFKAYKLQKEEKVDEISINISTDLYWNDTLIHGYKVSMYADSGTVYLQTPDAIYEVPEIIPDFDYWYRTLAYNDHYLIYSVRRKDNYRIVICKY
jgi:hypothetical protein